jgi:hypothetical protein
MKSTGANGPSELAFGQAPDTEGFVYFFLSPDGEAVKIGFTTNPSARLSGAAVWFAGDPNWEDIYPGTPADEAALHARLRPFHIKREWFYMTDEVWDFLEDLQDARITANLEQFGDPNRNEIQISELMEGVR